MAADAKVRKYLFVDDRWIAASHAVHRIIPVAEKDPDNPVLVADSSWETGVNCFGTVLEDPAGARSGRYRMWYQIYARGRYDDRRWDGAVGYAESADGRRWTKPACGLVTPSGETSNVVLLGRGRCELLSPAVVRDAEAPEEARYKLLHWDAMSAEDLEAVGDPFPLPAEKPGWKPLPGEGLFTATSPDGLSWRAVSPQPVVGGEVDASSLSRQADGRFAAYFKQGVRADRHFRVVARATSADFRAWTPAEPILCPDWRDPIGTEFYGMSGFDYFGTRLGLLWVYRNSPDDKRVEMELASEGPDGTWQRAADRRTLLPTGGRGDWDAGAIYPASAPVVAPKDDPDGIWLYYGGVSVRHDDGRYRENAIGRARLRLDGFACLAAGHFPGSVTTQPLPSPGRRLCVNLRAPHGSVQAAMIDARDGRELARTRLHSHIDATDLVLEWEAPPPALPADGEVQLRFDLHKAALYSFRFASGEGR